MALGSVGELTVELMLIPGLAGYEERVSRAIAAHLDRLGVAHRGDRLGNLYCTVEGDPNLPSVMVFTHMDQLGFIVRKIEPSGLIRVERLGGVPERALPAQAVVLCTDQGDIPALIAHKSHHATSQEEKYRVLPYKELYIDAGFTSKAEAEAAGVRIGTPVTYLPRALRLANGRIAGTSIDDRAGCAALLKLVESRLGKRGPTVHFVWSVQEEYNLRGVLPAATTLAPAIALQIDLLMACDTPDMADRGEVVMGGGAGMSLYSFHGRGTLNGIIPHPALVRLFEGAALGAGLALQRSAATGILTDLSYIQFMGDQGVACLDVGFPMRYSHSALEMVDPKDLEALVALLDAGISGVTSDLKLER